MELQTGCTLCPHACGAVRKQSLLSGSGSLGFCGMPQNPVVARAALHFGEEPCLCQPCGSGTVFFSGCTLQCSICQNDTISRQRWGIEIDAQRLSEIFQELEQKGAHNINLVSGTQFIPAILQALRIAKPSVPVVWNSGGYESKSSVEMLKDAVQVYLPDFKYADNALAKRISGVGDYAQTALSAIRAMVLQVGSVCLDDNGHMLRGVMVRHLILPGHLDNTLAVIDMLNGNFKKDEIWVSLMSQYTPCSLHPDMPELNRTVTTYEMKKAQNALFESGFHNGYMQDKSAATADAIPAFDGTGVLR